MATFLKRYQHQACHAKRQLLTEVFEEERKMINFLINNILHVLVIINSPLNVITIYSWRVDRH